MNNAQIIRAGKLRKDGTHALVVATEGKRLEWTVGFVGSWVFARCESETMAVKEAHACLTQIQDWLKESLYVAANHQMPKFNWHMDGTVANWERL